ncbi:MAG: hypothetical protein R2759_09875 [Bacteroidales bacterium]
MKISDTIENTIVEVEYYLESGMLTNKQEIAIFVAIKKLLLNRQKIKKGLIELESINEQIKAKDRELRKYYFVVIVLIIFGVIYSHRILYVVLQTSKISRYES